MQKTETKAHVLTEGEQKEVLTFFEQIISDPTKQPLMKAFLESISMMIRAFEGKSIESGDIITKLTHVQNILERSDFPTYPLLQEQVYLRLCAKIHPELFSFKDYAELKAHALISYKRQSRKEYVEMTKGLGIPEEMQTFFIGDRHTPQQQQPKRRFWQRKKEQPSEFISQ